MLRLASSRKYISVVADQKGKPTSALDLADAVLVVARELRRGRTKCGTFHFAGGGETTWYGFAQHIFAVSRAAGGPSAEALPVATAEYPTAARRPANSVLDCAKFARVFDRTAPAWTESVRACVLRLLQNSPGW
jgi:dTDP-4-dehydrorhamnose reductase